MYSVKHKIMELTAQLTCTSSCELTASLLNSVFGDIMLVAWLGCGGSIYTMEVCTLDYRQDLTSGFILSASWASYQEAMMHVHNKGINDWRYLWNIHMKDWHGRTVILLKYFCSSEKWVWYFLLSRGKLMLFLLEKELKYFKGTYSTFEFKTFCYCNKLTQTS